ncbi:GDSL lipase/acylhydrolase family protein, partial [Teratosphaeria nubilosa]
MKSHPFLASLASLSQALAHPPATWAHGNPSPYYPFPASSKWNLKTFTSLVVFGDSYTDDNRLNYFSTHNGSAPPVGWVDPVNYAAADGGRTWVQYVKQYTGINLYNYAVSGAVCSNDITPRLYAGINAPFPAVQQYEVPAYLADSKYTVNGSDFIIQPPEETVYAVWIGTNDLGVEAFIQDAQIKGTDLTSYVSCVYDQLSRVYDNGGRYFVILNNAPLQLAPMYAAPPYTAEPCGYWPDDHGNYTAISEKMLEQVVTTNALFEYRTPFEVEVARRYPGASFAVYDVNALFTDIYYNPSEYLNGTAPLNTTGYIHHCNLQRADCTTLPDPDSYMWYDELHPSEQTERLVAQNFVDLVKGSSKYATYWS